MDVITSYFKSLINAKKITSIFFNRNKKILWIY